MRSQRALLPDLLHIRLPIGAWISLLHRLSGAALALLAPVLLYALMLSLRSEADFQRLSSLLEAAWGRLILVGVIWAGVHHVFAGLRHLGFDMGWGVERRHARHTAMACLILGIGVSGAFAFGML